MIIRIPTCSEFDDVHSSAGDGAEASSGRSSNEGGMWALC